ncbi:hypothetical protein [Candidatus Poriferisodalis sp.]|uniref:hypothetical protein n=1 Tax=Candidatus Poriferisodalis sp. TaxID=3101277 RepID=UPI003B02C7F2
MISKRAKDSDEATDDSIDAAVARFADAVEAVRARTSGPLITAARALVYGLVIATAAIGAVVLVAIAAVRALDIAVPGEVWSAHLIAGAIFGGAGAWAWSRRRPRATREA